VRTAQRKVADARRGRRASSAAPARIAAEGLLEHRRRRCAAHAAGAAIRGQRAGRFAEELLDDAVQGCETYHCQARRRRARRSAAARPAISSSSSPLTKCARPGSCVWPDPGRAVGDSRGPCARHGELARGGQRPGGHHRAGDAARLALLAIAIEHIGNRSSLASLRKSAGLPSCDMRMSSGPSLEKAKPRAA